MAAVLTEGCPAKR